MADDAALFEVMRTMRAMRRLKPDPVPDELLERLVEAATWAPSGSNEQGYEHEWKRELAIPRDVNTYAVIPVGWPLGRFGPVTRRPAAEAIHRDRW